MNNNSENCDNSTDNCEPDGFDIFGFINYAVLMTILVWAGFVGNSLSVAIFLRPRLWVSFNYYLICLAIWDSLLLVSSFLQFSLWVLQDPNGGFNTTGPHASVLRWAFVLINTSLTGCVWIITCVTIERYMAISCPLRLRLFNNVARAKICLIGVSLAALIFNIPRYFEMNVVDICQFDCVNQRRIFTSQMKPSPLVDSQTYFVAYRVVGCCGFVYLIPCSILGVLTMRMCVAIHTATLERKRIAQDGRNRDISSRRVDNNTNRTLALILVKFLACYSLTTILDVLQIFLDPQYYHNSNLIEILASVSNQLVVLNSSSNFLIYYFGGKKFRLEYHNLCRGLKRNNSSATLRSNSRSYSTPNKSETQTEVKLLANKRPLKYYVATVNRTP